LDLNFLLTFFLFAHSVGSTAAPLILVEKVFSPAKGFTLMQSIDAKQQKETKNMGKKRLYQKHEYLKNLKF
jgi:hypothetical protein